MHERCRGCDGGVQRRRAVFAAFLACGILISALYGCRDELATEFDANLPPDTYLTGVPAESTTAFYRVHLYWHGNDTDGRVVGYEYVISDSLPADEDTLTYSYTTRTDSVFAFRVGASQQVLGHRFYIRAIDNDGAVDPDPAWTFFASLDLNPPSVRFTLAEAFDPELGTTVALTDSSAARTPADTVDAGWNVRFHWTGYDRDTMVDEFGDTIQVGEVVAFEQMLVPVDPEAILVGLEDTVRVLETLQSGRYLFRLSAVDDAGFKGLNPKLRNFVWNRDPQTRFLRAYREETGDSAVWIRATSEAWEGERVYFEGDTIPLIAAPNWGAVQEVSLLVGARGWDPDEQDDEEGNTIGRFQWRRGSGRWDNFPDSTTLLPFDNLKTTSFSLNARCADEYGRPDGSPAVLRIVVNRSPVLVDTLDEVGPVLQFPADNGDVDLVTIQNNQGRLPVRVRATDPDSTTNTFQYSMRIVGETALFSGEDTPEPGEAYLGNLEFPNAQQHALQGVVDTLEIWIEEIAVDDASPGLHVIRQIPFRVRE